MFERSNYEKGQSYEDMGERRRRAKEFGLLQEQKGSPLCLEHAGVEGPRGWKR